MCHRKKTPGDRCYFSIECNDEDAFCLRPFFKRRGYCIRISNDRLNSIAGKINDLAFQGATKVKSFLTRFFQRNGN